MLLTNEKKLNSESITMVDEYKIKVAGAESTVSLLRVKEDEFFQNIDSAKVYTYSSTH